MSRITDERDYCQFRRRRGNKIWGGPNLCAARLGRETTNRISDFREIQFGEITAEYVTVLRKTRLRAFT